MLEQLKYINHLEEEIVIGRDGVFTNESNLYSYRWKFENSNLISEAIPRKLELIILKDYEFRDKIIDIFEKDVISGKSGKLYKNNYYLKCFVVGVNLKDYLLDENFIRIEIDIVPIYPKWIKNIEVSYRAGGKVVGMNENQQKKKRNLDLKVDFPYDYSSSSLKREIINSTYAPANFLMSIYGKVNNPKITIGTNVYEVKVNLEVGEVLQIDSLNKTIKKLSRGQEENIFHLRNREYYIFEKIKSGLNPIFWSGAFGFDIVVFEERSEPRWI